VSIYPPSKNITQIYNDVTGKVDAITQNKSNSKKASKDLLSAISTLIDVKEVPAKPEDWELFLDKRKDNPELVMSKKQQEYVHYKNCFKKHEGKVTDKTLKEEVEKRKKRVLGKDKNSTSTSKLKKDNQENLSNTSTKKNKKAEIIYNRNTILGDPNLITPLKTTSHEDYKPPPKINKLTYKKRLIKHNGQLSADASITSAIKKVSQRIEKLKLSMARDPLNEKLKKLYELNDEKLTKLNAKRRSQTFPYSVKKK
tara:strand:- start:558 stop:1322 length:765 start_codon:yes stop_codon:yes gene_type:complete